MRDAMTVWPWLFVAQAYGIGIGWLIDSWSWRRRKAKKDLVPYAAAMLLALALFVIPFTGIPFFAAGFVLTICWATSIVPLQVRQFGESGSVTFWGALFQLWFFILAMFVGGLIFSAMNIDRGPRWYVSSIPLLGVLIVSAVVTHLLFTLFRPAIDWGARQAQTFINEKMAALRHPR